MKGIFFSILFIPFIPVKLLMSKTNPARGMRDFLPADVRKRDYVIGIIKEVYESYGFEPLETPSVENLETLMGKYGEEGNQLIYKILKRGKNSTQRSQTIRNPKSDRSASIKPTRLRYDLTFPLARVVANRRTTSRNFFKRYQIQPSGVPIVRRRTLPRFYQCDVDAIGFDIDDRRSRIDKRSERDPDETGLQGLRRTHQSSRDPHDILDTCRCADRIAWRRSRGDR
jgi:hypothetical protein